MQFSILTGSLVIGEAETPEVHQAYETFTMTANPDRSRRFTWWTPFDKELHIWRTGPENVLVKELVAKGDKAGTLYQVVSQDVV